MAVAVAVAANMMSRDATQAHDRCSSEGFRPAAALPLEVVMPKTSTRLRLALAFVVVLLLSGCAGTVSVGGPDQSCSPNFTPSMSWAQYLPSKRVRVNVFSGASTPMSLPSAMSSMSK